jgi:hypothetical protein
MNLNLTTTHITYLRDVPSNMEVDMTSGWRYHYFDGSIPELSTFIKLIGDDKIYLLIPLFTNANSTSSLNLSLPFLVNNQSNSALIINFILDQWKSSGFELKVDSQIIFSFKFKRVWISHR